MSERKINRRPLRKSAVGDRRERIVLYERGIANPVFGSSAPREKDISSVTTWAKVVTVKPRKDFDNVNPERDQATHRFNIRYRPDITSETRIRWRGNNYDILDIDNHEERNMELELYAVIEGDKDKGANQ